MTTILAELFKHNAWANDRLLEVCAGLDSHQLNATVEGTFGTIGETLAHIAGAESSYYARFTGGSWEEARLTPEEEGDVAALRERLRRSGAGFVALAERMSADEVLEGTWRGNPYAIPASILLTQVINHATEHRSQIATILTQQGIEPPDFSGWAWDRS